MRKLTQKKPTGITKDLYEAIVRIINDKVQDIKVTREEFDGLKIAVEELARAQKKTEEKLEILAQRVDDLALAQKRTEERVEELAAAQKRTEEKVEELAQAQKRTEDAVSQLAKAVGALSDVIGFGLEDIARVVLPGYLERHLKIQVPELERRFIEIDSKEIEINLYAEGKREGKEVIVIGECKSRIYKTEVEKFAIQIEEIESSLSKEIIKVLFGYLIHPSAVREATKKGILLVASYQR